MNKPKQISEGCYRTEITIDIYSINVNEECFSFNYKAWINSNLEPIVGSYNSSHSHRTEEEQEKFKTLIKESFGHQLALERIINENLWK